jgi:hypothetical protein
MNGNLSISLFSKSLSGSVFCFLVITFLALPIIGQVSEPETPGNTSEKPRITAKALLEMPLDRAFPLIENLSKSDSQSLVSELRSLGKVKDPNFDTLYFLITHLEEIQAVEKEQNRLNSLNWVYLLGFLGFSGFLLYLMIQQRKTLRFLERNLK